MVRIAGEERYIAAEDAGLYRDALGVPEPAGLPESFLEPVEDALVSLVRRYAATHVPFPTRQLADRYGVDPSSALKELERSGDVVRGELLPGGTAREWCEADVLRRLRRASLARLRKEVEADRSARAGPIPAELAERRCPRPLRCRSPDRLREALISLQGVALTPKTWERDVLPRRLGVLQPDLARRALHQRRARLGRRRVARPQRRQGRPLLPRGRPARRPAAGQREARSSRGRDPRRDPRAPRPGALLLARPAGAGGLGRGAPRGPLGPGLVRRGDQRRLRAAAGARACGPPSAPSAAAAASPVAVRPRPGP